MPEGTYLAIQRSVECVGGRTALSRIYIGTRRCGLGIGGYERSRVVALLHDSNGLRNVFLCIAESNDSRALHRRIVLGEMHVKNTVITFAYNGPILIGGYFIRDISRDVVADGTLQIAYRLLVRRNDHRQRTLGQGGLCGSRCTGDQSRSGKTDLNE